MSEIDKNQDIEQAEQLAPVDAIDTQPANDGTELFDALVKTAAKTAYWMFVGIILFFGAFVNLLPFESMRFYMEINNDLRAFECAEMAYSRMSDSDATENFNMYYETLTNCIELSNKLSQNKNTKTARRYAEKTKKYAKIYLSRTNSAEYSKKLDDFYKSKLSRAAHVSVYSYEHTVYSYYFNACLILGEDVVYTDRVEFGFPFGRLSRWQFLSDELNYQGSAYNINNVFFARLMLDTNAYIKHELSRIGYSREAAARYTQQTGKMSLEQFCADKNIRLSSNPISFAAFYDFDANAITQFNSLIKSTFTQVKTLVLKPFESLPTYNSDTLLTDMYYCGIIGEISANMGTMPHLVFILDDNSPSYINDEKNLWQTQLQLTNLGLQPQYETFIINLFEKNLLPLYALGTN